MYFDHLRGEGEGLNNFGDHTLINLHSKHSTLMGWGLEPQQASIQARSNLLGRYGHGRTIFLWGTQTSEYVKVGVVFTTAQYGRTTSKLLATVLPYQLSAIVVEAGGP